MRFLNYLLTALSFALAIPAMTLFAEVVFAFGFRRTTPAAQGPRPRIAVLMPAHDEALGILRALQCLLPQLLPTDRLLVVADNCSDDTAAVAAAAGAEVIERHNPEKRGKGYALDFGVRHLELDPPDVVVIADADCNFSTESLDRLAKECRKVGRPVQALYLMQAPEGAGTRVQIAEFAWVVKNQVRPTGLLALGLPCHLMGTGMAFPWECIHSAQLATGHIVEDMQLGLELARRGEPPHFCPDVRVTSSFPRTEEGIRTQRTRWEHGHLGVIFSHAPQLLRVGLRRFDARAVALALDLIVPPLALFVMLACMNAIVDAAFALMHGSTVPLLVGSITLGLVVLSVIISWIRYGRHIISFAKLATAPVYAVRKIPVYVSFLWSRQLDWVRSKRDL